MHSALIVTQYCERDAAAFWAESFNALSNAAFIAAAVFFLWRAGAAGRRLSLDVFMLAALAIATGVGSFLWHTFAEPWSQWADILPIALFINLYLVSFLLRAAGLSRPLTAGLWLGFAAANAAGQLLFPPDLFNGSIAYLPTLAALWSLALFCRPRHVRQANLLVAMAALFSVSLLLRTLDASLCGIFPRGTHFLWHLLNAGVVYMALRSLSD